jgi:UDP-glucuronate 4-epimerase
MPIFSLAANACASARRRCVVLICLSEAIGKKAKRELLPMQPGNVSATFANVDDLMREVGFRSLTSIADGIARFVDWYRAYHRL